jgi:hypothetical protein
LYGSSSDEDESESSLAGMMYSMDDEEDDYLDSLATNLFAK